MTPNAQLVINSRDRFILYPNELDPRTAPPFTTSQPWNNFSLINQGQNIVQGNIDKIQVAEIRFPYDIPNVIQEYTDGFSIVYGTLFSEDMNIVVGQGFYTGSELATEVQDAIDTACSLETPAIVAPNIPQVTYNEAGNFFTFSNPGTLNTYQVRDTGLVFNGSINNGPPAQTGSLLRKSLLSMMGMTPINPNSTSDSDALFTLTANSSYTGGVAPLIYTEYVDIVSKSLCGNVYVADGSTQQRGGFRKDILCRVYISDETSSQSGYVYDSSGNPMLSVVGTRPFVIHRQFKNAKVIPNNLLNSLNLVDIQVYGDDGQLIPLPDPTFGVGVYQDYRNFQITLNVFETDRKQAT